MGNYKGDDRLEKFYTPQQLIDEMFILKDKFVDFEITEYLENSAGGGAICDRFDKPYIAYDIMPEPDRDDIKQCNYLKEKIEYKKGRVAIINPPFQQGIKFLYKALEESDYVISILSQNSLINIDYNRIEFDEIQLWRNYEFGTTKVGIIIIACRLKDRNNDR